MAEFVTKLFSSDFMPHGHCYFWQPAILWTHVISDLVTMVSYYSIPIALVYLVRKRADLAFNWIFLMFAAFIFACGTTHLMDVWTTWNGTYRIEGVIKLVTGLVSATTAVALWRLMPRALAIPTVAQIRQETTQKVLAQEQLHRTEVKLALESKSREELQVLLREQEVLKNELDHRVKNTLALVMSLSNQTAANSSSLESFTESFGGRLRALSRSHQLLNGRRWGEVRLHEIVEATLRPYHTTQEDRIRVCGPEVFMNPREAQTFHMVFHELATNAVKYGALTQEGGRLDVTWSVKNGENGSNLSINWAEFGDKKMEGVREPEGFGTRLIHYLIEFDLSGSVKMQLHPDGVRYAIECPLSRSKAAEQAANA